MEKFYCSHCQKIFEAEGEKIFWEDKIYGKCFKKIAYCPDCQKECEEYRVNKNSRSCSNKCSNCPGCFGF
jgi:hypothetical protein